MIIELSGLPGSGKSTFAKKLAEESGWVVISVGGRLELLVLNAAFLFAHPVSCFLQLLWLFRYRGKSEFWYAKFMNLFLVHNAKFMKARMYPRAVIDQGHHQNIISLFDVALPEDVIHSYAKFLPKPDLVCFLVADRDTREERLSARKWKPRQELSQGEWEEWQRVCETNLAIIIDGRRALSCNTMIIQRGEEDDAARRLRRARPWRFVMHLRVPTEKAHGLQIAKTLDALAKSGEFVGLWIPKRTNAIREDISKYYSLDQGFPVLNMPTPGFLRLARVLGKWAYWLDALGFFLVVAFARIPKDAVCYTRSAELAWLLEKKGCQTFFEAHSWPSSKGRLFKMLLNNVSLIVANSGGTADEFRRRGFTRVEVVPNGVDIERFRNLPEKDAARRTLGLPVQKKVVVYTGAFYGWKGVPFILETWQKYFSQDAHMHLVLVGGDERDLRKHGGYDAYRNSGNVSLVTHQPSATIPLYLAASDALVIPNVPVTKESVQYTSPIKLFEYMASGRPIIAADLPSIREILSEKAGYFAKAGDAEDFARIITGVLGNEAEARERASSAQRVSEKYSWQHRATLLRELAYSSSPGKPA